MIAGFDVEHNQTAADGSVYDNGYGIALVPVTPIGDGKRWNNSSDKTSYISSTMHTTNLPIVATALQTVLGSHLVNRNVLLSSSVDSSGYSSAYTWTTSYCTLMSVGQMNGIFDSYNNKYDDGEANYKLPVFNYTNFSTESRSFWTRCNYGNGYAWYIYHTNSIAGIGYTFTSSIFMRPLIYIR